MSESRHHFLENHWIRYPAMPSGNFVCGRIATLGAHQITIEDEMSVVITEQTKVLPTQKGSPKVPIHEILQVGDLVAINAQEVWLLVPKMKDFPLAAKHPARKTLTEFAEFFESIRHFFKAQGFLEASTPGLVDCPGTEPYLEAFATEFIMGRTRRKMMLPTSPELHLKKMLALGLGPLFEIKNCFRNGEISSHHEPEFFMLEWYRPYRDLAAIADDVEQLLRSLSGNPTLRLETVSIQELFEKFFHFQLSPTTTHAEFLALAQTQGIETQASDSIDDVFNRLFLEGIESKLPTSTPLLVNGYPPFLAAYARLTPDGWADRFEIYWHGLELANAFHEINDPALQKNRMLEDLKKKSEVGRPAVSLDEEFFNALEFGMPPSAGIAFGVDRLYMVLKGLKEIQDLKVFPYGRFL